MCALSKAALEGQVQPFQCWCSLPLKKQCDRFRYGKHGHTLTLIFEKNGIIMIKAKIIMFE